jgi:mycofactocin system creatininase family protein
MELGRATWKEVADTDRRGLLAIPIGSLEQHGPHLPLDTDTRIAVALVDELARLQPHVMAAPAFPYGASGEHAAFPGTLLVHHQLLADLVVELVRSARDAFAGVVLVSAHGGNREGLALAQERCRADGDDDVVFWHVRAEGADAHAGRTETSLMLWIDAASVRMDLAEAGCTTPIDQLLPRLRSEGVRPISSNGVLGDPVGATAEEGRALLASMTADLVAAVTARWPLAAVRA